MANYNYDDDDTKTDPFAITNKTQALARIHQDHVLLEVYQVEKETVDEIIDQALNYPSSANRWPAYEALKKQAKFIVGWDSLHDQLGTSMHFREMIKFVDYLLPDTIEEEFEDEDLDEYGNPIVERHLDPDEVARWHTRATQMLEQQKVRRQALLLAKKNEQLLAEEKDEEE